MSRSPRNTLEEDEVESYRAGWEAVMRLVRSGRSWSGYERNNVYANLGSGRFADVAALSGLDFQDDGRAVGITDWDQDGDLDLWLRNRTGPRLRLMLNRTRDREGGAFVALRLRGTTSNRDAVGARVEVLIEGSGGERLVRAVRAGEGFLSQSTKWLHFGLGRDPGRIEEVVVRWPAGAVERFSGVARGGRYRLVQGRGVAEPWTAAPRRVDLPAVPGKAPEPSGAVRILLAPRPPLPALRFVPLEGPGPAGRVTAAARPLFVTFWASWCLPCVEEIEELARRAEVARQAGFDVLALFVDDVATEEAKADAGAARALLGRIGFPFPAGGATAESLDKVQRLQEALFDRPPAFGVPLSLLVDAQGDVAAIYRGRAGLDQVAADIALLGIEGDAWRRTALPLGGRWHGASPARDEVLADLADRVAPADPEEEIALLDEAVADLEARGALPPPDAGRTARTAVLLRRLASRLAASGRDADAVERYDRALRIGAGDARTHNDLGVALSRLGRIEEAAGHFRRALALEPAHAEANHNLGLALFLAGNPREAVPFLRRAVDADPEDGEMHYHLGVALTMVGLSAEAVGHLRDAVRLRPGDPAPMVQAAWILATHPDAAERDPAEAVRLAERAAGIVEPDATTLDTLAAAYAAAGRFDRAVATAEAALQGAERAGEAELAGYVRQRLELYRSGRPHLEPPVPPEAAGRR